MNKIEDLKGLYKNIKPLILQRIKEFELIGNSGSQRIFAELCFCLLTPQSKAKVCWRAVENLMKEKILFKFIDADTVKHFLKGIRFYHKKAEYILYAKQNLYPRLIEVLKSYKEDRVLREYFVKNVKGMGYKESTHFLRNIGRAKNMAILDRHILNNMKEFGYIKEVPSNLSKRRYYYIEDKFRKFSIEVGISVVELDLLLWYKQTGEVFK